MSDDPRATLAARQADLVAALVAGGTPPPGVDPHRVEVTARALRRKRTREAATQWPALLATAAARDRFARWAAERPRTSAFVDGWDFADDDERGGRLDEAAAAELATVRTRWRRGPGGLPVARRRWWPPTARR